MNDRWQPTPPPNSRAGLLGFIFVLILFAAMAALLFVLNPFVPPVVVLVETPTALPASPTPTAPAAAPLPPQFVVFLPLIDG